MEIRNRSLTQDEFRRMQFLMLDMLVEFDRVCKDNNINYVIIAGTMLGAIRHQGFIPWDDDADIGILREDYEKFKKVSGQLNEHICFFQDHTTDPGYRWGYGKLRHTGTTFLRKGQEHLKCKTGIFVDIFPLDDVPNSTIGQMFQDIYCYCCRKILWSEVAKKTCNGIKRYWFSLLSTIPTDIIFRLLDVYIRKSRNDNNKLVRILCFTATGKLYYKHPIEERYGMKKRWFTERQQYLFEGHLLWGSKNYDEPLRHWFNDYMTLPPEHERKSHPFSMIDLGDRQ